jgi:DNA-binding winged helix-turn-helix (wHTH) protein/class 3 adenylate cyclase/tetratricopeptide (TPR) repeat protein
LPDAQFLEFGTFRIDTGRGRLERGGELVPVPPKAFDLLLLLVHQPGKVLSKSELMRALWPEVFVEEANLTQHVFTLRKALGVQPGGQPYIETVPRRGYSFKAEVRVASANAAATESEGAVCLACRGPMPAGALFCPGCGTPLRPSPPLPPPGVVHEEADRAADVDHEGERKIATVVHCGVPNAAALAECLGAGGLLYLMRRLFGVAADETRRYDGVVGERHGDGFVALFGARATHEDDARRAVLAALNIGRRARELWRGETEVEERLVVQMGLDTGPVVIGRVTGTRDVEYSAVGEAVRAADLLQQFAAPGAILLSGATRDAVEGHFNTEPVTIATPWGKVTAHRVSGLAGPPAALSMARRGRPLSPFVGRRSELTVLEDLAGRALTGDGQVVTIVGEPGMGKSRLVHELARTPLAAVAALLEGRALSYGNSVPCLPLVDLVRARCGVGAAAGPDEIAGLVERQARELDLPADAASWLLRLVGIDAGSAGATTPTPEAAKARTFEVLRLLLLRASMRQPLVIVVEDLHWIDTTSEEFMESLVERLPGARICLVATARSGYRTPWMDRSYATQITLRPLGAGDSTDLLESVAGEHLLPRPVADAILAKAEGNPFFLEELAHTVVEHGPENRLIPDTIQGVIMGRVDRLPAATKQLLQTAAVIGREVPRALLSRVFEGAADFEQDVAELCRLEFMYERPGEQVVYVFKHALTQEVAYDSLLTRRRSALHERAAGALLEMHADRLDEVAAPLAYHYARTDRIEESVRWLIRVAEQAARVYANAEAIQHLELARRRLERLAEGPERDRRMIEVALRHAHSLYFMGRFRESVDVLLRHDVPLVRLDDPALFASCAFWLGHMYSRLGDQPRAAAGAARAIEMAEKAGDEVTRAKAYGVLALEGAWSGRPTEGIAHGEEAIRVLREHPDQGWYLGMAHVYVAMNHLHAGRFEEALASTARVDETGREMGDPRLPSYAGFFAGWVEASRGNVEAAIALCETSRDRAPDRVAHVYATMILGFAVLEYGDAARARGLLEPMARELEAFGIPQFGAFATALSADALRIEGRLDAAAASARNGLELALGAQYWYAVGFARRVLGRVAHDAGQLEAAAEELTEALHTFDRAGSAFEAGRTRLDLAAVARDRGDRDRARDELRAASLAFAQLGTTVYAARAARFFAELSTPAVPPPGSSP